MTPALVTSNTVMQDAVTKTYPVICPMESERGVSIQEKTADNSCSEIKENSAANDSMFSNENRQPKPDAEGYYNSVETTIYTIQF